jgi:hypothetical protein
MQVVVDHWRVHGIDGSVGLTSLSPRPENSENSEANGNIERPRDNAIDGFPFPRLIDAQLD